MNKKTLLILIILIILTDICSASQGINLVTMGMGAKEMSMGSTGLVSSKGVHSIFWNPAGISKVSNVNVTGSYSYLFEAAHDYYFGISIPAKGPYFGFGYYHISYNDIDITDDYDFIKTEDFSEKLILFSGNFKTSGTLKIGASLKYIKQNLYKYEESAYACDAGLLKDFKKLKTGLILRNLFSSRLGIDAVPFNFVIGALYPFILTPKSTKKKTPVKLNIEVNISYITTEGIDFLLGAEFFLYKFIALRTGYNNGITFGAGVMYKNFQLDIALLAKEISNNYKVSITSRF